MCIKNFKPPKSELASEIQICQWPSQNHYKCNNISQVMQIQCKLALQWHTPPYQQLTGSISMKASSSVYSIRIHIRHVVGSHRGIPGSIAQLYLPCASRQELHATEILVHRCSWLVGLVQLVCQLRCIALLTFCQAQGMLCGFGGKEK